ncbi:MAG TPA: hypothetical protein PLA77_04955 [Bacteroidales bacterium]|nr:hypothetical protein [Bacteroidales bacterium]
MHYAIEILRKKRYELQHQMSHARRCGMDISHPEYNSMQAKVNGINNAIRLIQLDGLIYNKYGNAKTTVCTR